MQGDIVWSCPVLAWKDQALEFEEGDSPEVLAGHCDAVCTDVIVMTQACDLAQNKVRNVTLCPHCSLSEYKEAWEEDRAAKDQSTSTKAWRARCNNIRNGFLWNLAAR